MLRRNPGLPGRRLTAVTGGSRTPSRASRGAGLRGCGRLAPGIAALAVLAAVAACGPAGPPVVSVSTPAAQPGRGPLPAVSGAGVRALWEGQWGWLTVSDGMVLGWGAQIDAARAVTGVPAWTATLPRSLPDILGLVPAGKVVLIEAGRDFGQPPAEVFPAVTYYIALDQATGRQLWTLPADGRMQQPPVAVAGNLLLITDRTGMVTARHAATSAIAWRASLPAGCAATFYPIPPGVALAADGPLITASYACDSGARIVVRLAPTTGLPLWTWRPAGIATAGPASVIGAARNGNAVLVATSAAPPSTRAYPWPAAFSASDQDGAVVVLDAATGHPRWSEPDGQQESFVMTDAVVCETFQAGHAGAQCRDDISGAATMPALISGPGAGRRDAPSLCLILATGSWSPRSLPAEAGPRCASRESTVARPRRWPNSRSAASPTSSRTTSP